jgi:predicted GH43/DUF377 family glycosyl hydrolase
VKVNDKQEHVYDIKYASSRDGKRWDLSGETAIERRDWFEALTRPTVIKMDGTYHMWFSYRGSRDFRGGEDSYRIGYATSKDLRNWKRNDAMSGIDVSNSGWDSKMIAYPCVDKINDQIIMLYNGNDFGLYGFGYAILETQG